MELLIGQKEKLGVAPANGRAPYDELYVYLLDGQVGREEEASLGGDYIGNWVEEGTSFLFFTRSAREEISGLLKRRPDLGLVDDFRFTYEQWQGGCLEPLRVAGFLITPPWLHADPQEGATKILLDSGVVFGNGLHPTTRDCLKALVCARKSLPLGKVLDLGTGTGVLSLAAAFLNAEKVLAADLNPLCVKTAARNVLLNHLEDKIEVVEGSAESFIEEPADLMVANIHHAVIRDLLEKRVFRKNDRVIISGLMRSQAREVKVQLVHSHFRLLREWDYDMTWFTFLAEIG
jgi:ribosomal protein L11 methyltransferase